MRRLRPGKWHSDSLSDFATIAVRYGYKRFLLCTHDSFWDPRRDSWYPSFDWHVVVADFHDRETPLPPHQLVVNGIGESDVASGALVAAESLLAMTSAPVVTFRVRCWQAAVARMPRLGKLSAIKAPFTVAFSHSLLGGEKGAATLAAGFTFPCCCVRQASTWVNTLCG